MQPTRIKRDAVRNLLAVTWEDGSTSEYPIKFLRDECPCAGCKGETILGTHYAAPLKIYQEGMYELSKLVPVGSYAVQAYWRDGHDTGIYSWEYLRMLADALAQSPGA